MLLFSQVCKDADNGADQCAVHRYPEKNQDQHEHSFGERRRSDVANNNYGDRRQVEVETTQNRELGT
eukprot:3404190-Prymnesium_polylepis.2